MLTRSVLLHSLPLDLFDPPLLGRAGFTQKVINKDPFVVNDDVVSRHGDDDFGLW
jgi:hypothetical protein